MRYIISLGDCESDEDDEASFGCKHPFEDVGASPTNLSMNLQLDDTPESEATCKSGRSSKFQYR